MTREFLQYFVPGAVFVYLLLVLRLVLEIWTGPHERFTVRFFLAAVALFASSALAIVVFQDVANSYRRVGPEQILRQGEDREEYVAQARRAYLLICAGIAVVAAALALVVARGPYGIDWPVSLAFVTLTGLYFLVMFTHVEYLNSCYIGESFLYDRHCR